ncbi:MAG: NifB/NifX family molybdenum-iron cluster-binding protein [Breznakibacter sp.]|nr:NifB/NifX family molybdenum-iron cluster-binding protein [Breznakibacter sp.]
MRIAVPTNQNMVDSHFGHCAAFLIFDIENQTITAQQEFMPPPGCGCKSNLVHDLKQLGVTILLAGNMGQGAYDKLTQAGLTVVRGCSGDAKEAVGKYINHQLTDDKILCDHHHNSCNHESH